MINKEIYIDKLKQFTKSKSLRKYISKTFICKGCGEKFNIGMQSSNVGYCCICDEFYRYIQKAILKSPTKLKELDGGINEKKNN